jgi:HSP20 family protein
MDKPSTIHWRALKGQLGRVAYEYTRVQVQWFNAATPWAPPINCYRCAQGFAVCVELAGVDRSRISIEAQNRALVIRGHRQAPVPDETRGQATQVLALEIDYGDFERQVLLPAEVDPERVEAEQRDGLLWIYLPLRNAT